MKNFNYLKKQHGAVLAFSLVMLLLLTLAGTRMIQQNKQQLEMANSMRLSTQQFANAEGILAEAKNIINTHSAHVDASGTVINDKSHQCTATASFKQNVLLAGTTLFANSSLLAGKVTILKVRCQSALGTEQICSSYDTGTLKCKPSSDNFNCTAGTVLDDASITAHFSTASDRCYQNYDPQSNDLNLTCNTTNPPEWCTSGNKSCPKEIYTIQVISTDVNGTTREIISDHVVGCG